VYVLPTHHHTTTPHTTPQHKWKRSAEEPQIISQWYIASRIDNGQLIISTQKYLILLNTFDPVARDKVDRHAGYA
jgi:hypothetical protein